MNTDKMKIFLLILTAVLVSCTQENVFEREFSKDEIKLCFLGDTGTGSAVQRRVAEELKKENCDTFHFLGDLVYPDGVNGSNDPQIKSKFLDIYHDLDGPIYIILGNHDHRGSIEAWKEVSRNHSKVFFPNFYFMIKVKELCLVHLDTNLLKLPLRWHFGIAQAWWLANIEVSSCKKKIALTHHPFESRGGHHGPASGLVRFMLWSQVMDKYDFLISGHEHLLSDEGYRGDTSMLISGAGGAPDKDESGGYLVMVVKFNGKQIDSVKVNFRPLR